MALHDTEFVLELYLNNKSSIKYKWLSIEMNCTGDRFHARIPPENILSLCMLYWMLVKQMHI